MIVYLQRYSKTEHLSEKTHSWILEKGCMEENNMDFYLQSNNSYNRLEEEFKKYGKLIFCVDFDDTIYDFHKKGRTYENVISLLHRWKQRGSNPWPSACEADALPLSYISVMYLS